MIIAHFFVQVPNDIMKGETLDYRAYIYHTDNQLIEICVAADIDVV
jgi:hypothetical protein